MNDKLLWEAGMAVRDGSTAMLRVLRTMLCKPVNYYESCERAIASSRHKEFPGLKSDSRDIP